jgi:hypothetical protein
MSFSFQLPGETFSQGESLTMLSSTQLQRFHSCESQWSQELERVASPLIFDLEAFRQLIRDEQGETAA